MQKVRPPRKQLPTARELSGVAASVPPLAAAAFVGISTDLLYWRLATGGWPWSYSANRKGKYIKISDYDEATGRFKGAMDFSVNEVLGLADRAIMQQQLEAKDRRIVELEKMIKK